MDERVSGVVMLRAGDCGFGVMLPTFDAFRAGKLPLLDCAELAEELGFDSGWVGDHLSFHPPVLDAITALAAAAARTERLVLGTGVLLLPLRHAVWTAKQWATLAALAPDRVVLGVGVGGENPSEWEAAGVSVANRGRRLDESLEIVGALLRGEQVNHAGPLLPVRSPALEPFPANRVPLVVGGRSESALRRAARVADGWLGVWLSVRRLTEIRAELDEYTEQYGRPRCSMLLMVFVHVTDDAAAAQSEVATFVQGQYGLPFDKLGRWVLIGDEKHVAAELAELRATGVEGFVLVPAARDPLAQYSRLASVRALLDG